MYSESSFDKVELTYFFLSSVGSVSDVYGPVKRVMYIRGSRLSETENEITYSIPVCPNTLFTR